MKRFFLVSLLVSLLSTSCFRPSITTDRVSLPLASFTENNVDVLIRLEDDQQGGVILSASFNPPEGYHLYSKDTPRIGLNGLGRPTLLELPANSLMTASSELMESVKAQVPDFEPRELLVYPVGAVTLSLRVELPQGDEWADDFVSVTYMACSDTLCYPPVMGKLVPIRVPGVDVSNPQ